MKNIYKGWVTSIIGLAIMISAVLYSFGFISPPAPAAISKPIQLGIAFAVGLFLFLMPQTVIEKLLNDIKDRLMK